MFANKTDLPLHNIKRYSPKGKIINYLDVIESEFNGSIFEIKFNLKHNIKLEGFFLYKIIDEEEKYKDSVMKINFSSKVNEDSILEFYLIPELKNLKGYECENIFSNWNSKESESFLVFRSK